MGKNGSDPENIQPEGSTNHTCNYDKFVMYQRHTAVVRNSAPKSKSPTDTVHTGYSDTYSYAVNGQH